MGHMRRYTHLRYGTRTFRQPLRHPNDRSEGGAHLLHFYVVLRCFIYHTPSTHTTSYTYGLLGPQERRAIRRPVSAEEYHSVERLFTAEVPPAVSYLLFIIC